MFVFLYNFLIQKLKYVWFVPYFPIEIGSMENDFMNK